MPFGIPLRMDFPPEHLLRATLAGAVDELETRTERLRKLENLYHRGQEMAWDGRAVLRELVAKHGGVRAPVEKREAIANIFTIIMWGELGAWEVASHLATHIRDHTAAKMAATIQTFDEARHYYVMRDYLALLDVPLPPPNAFVKSMLGQLIETDSMLYKLIGMQLFVEHVAVHLFRAMAEARVEPVLTDLLPYFHRDEARHVGLGRLYLPDLLSRISRREAMELQLYQLWLVTFMQLSIEYHRQDAAVLGIDIQSALTRALKDQTRMLEEITSHQGVRGIVLTPRKLRFVIKWLIRNLWETGEGADKTVLSTPRMREMRARVVRATERAWRAVA